MSEEERLNKIINLQDEQIRVCKEYIASINELVNGYREALKAAKIYPFGDES